ncbi:MAG TPA: hypothetical protein VG737_17510, partial [Cyclobacteriaceae bacterium]|nr:hypothetical protein [Cyclobacteriaceae bacterium]
MPKQSDVRVFKFGGASVRHAAAIRKVAGIIRLFQHEKILVVVSAIGKTTNALERVVANFRQGQDYKEALTEIRAHHETVMNDLFARNHPVWGKVVNEFRELEN